MTITIEQVENGYVIESDGRHWIADSPETVKDIIEELLEELDDNEDE